MKYILQCKLVSTTTVFNNYSSIAHEAEGKTTLARQKNCDKTTLAR